MASFVFSSSMLVIVFECPTSRVSVFHNLLKLSRHFPAKVPFSVWMNLGHRVGLLGGMMDALQRKFPGRPVYAIQMAVGRQSERVKPSYGLYIPLDAKIESGAPTSVSVAGCRAATSEGIRLVCTNEDCPLRPRPAAGADGAAGEEGAGEAALLDIPVEDTDEPDFEACFEAGEDEDDANALAAMDTDSQDVGVDPDSKKKRKYVASL